MNLREIQKKLGNTFSLIELAKFKNEKKEYLSKYISEQISANKISKIRSGWFTFLDDYSKYLIACTYKKSYITLQSALEFYGYSTQRYITLELCSYIKKKNKTINGYNIQFLTTTKKKFFGFKKEKYQGNDFLIADKEKLLIDCLTNQDKLTFGEFKSFIAQEKFDKDKIESYAKRINSKALNKRLGYILELQGFKNIDLEINNKYEKLNLQKSITDQKNTKWKLYVNEEIKDE